MAIPIFYWFVLDKILSVPALSTIDFPCPDHFNEFGASLCWNLDFEKPKKLSKFRLKFSKSIRRKNSMVLKACSLIKRPPTGQVGLSAKRSLGLRLFLFCLDFILIFGWGRGGGPTPAEPRWFLHWRGTRFWKRRECGR